MYKFYSKNTYNGVNPNRIERLSDHACIPFDINNVDYQEYLHWLNEGNVPEPADESNNQSN